MEKGPDAFRTISEVAEDLDLPQHVLRFWETRFPQIRPLKRGGGRRYYRPDDVELLRGIRHLLYGEGYTIRGVQRILKEEGPRYVQAIWRDVEADDQAVAELDAREERATRHAGPLDAGPAGRTREEQAPPRSGPLSGILNLLPTRQREAPEEPAPRRARRRPENAPDLLELPLLPDLEPQVKPPRAEPALRHMPPFAEPQPRQEVPQRPDVPPRYAPEPSEPRRIEPRDAAPLPETPPPEIRPVFPFRAVAAEPAHDAFRDDDFRDDAGYVPERARPEPPVPVRPASAPPIAYAPLRAGGVHDDETPARTKLSRDDVQRLQAALYELQDCRRLLDAVRDRDD